jgi:hypothetical protein
MPQDYPALLLFRALSNRAEPKPRRGKNCREAEPDRPSLPPALPGRPSHKHLEDNKIFLARPMH